MIEIGKHNRLRVARRVPFGVYLADNEKNEVLLPEKYIPKGGVAEDSYLTVFVYKDNQQRPIATTLMPKIGLFQFAPLKVVSVTKIGAFVDWGLEKHLFVPFREQSPRMEEGRKYLIHMYLDEQSNRLIGSNRVGRFLSNQYLEVEVGQEVDIMIWKNTRLGVNVIVNEQHIGLIYHNERFSKLEMGDVMKGYVSAIRPDNKLDIRLQKEGAKSIEPNAKKILARLKLEGGFLPLTDKSPPQEIYHHLGMSKKSFKKAIGSLYKQRLITLETNGIELTEQ